MALMLSNCPRALVVDDQRDAAESFARVLAAMGCHAEFVTDPSLVMNTVERLRPQIVFLDLGMPVINGYELARLLRDKYGWQDGIRLVAVTGYGSDEHRALSRTAGFDAHVLKPVSPELVESMVRTLFPEIDIPAGAPGAGLWEPAAPGAIPAVSGYPLPPRTRILLAVTQDVLQRFQRILDRHDLTVISDSREAMRALEDHFGLVIVSVHFDESQMFSLLGDVRAHSNYRKIPILCVLGTHRVLTDIAIEGLDHAVKAMRANGFLDLHHFDDDNEGNARIRRIVDYLILIDGDLQHIARVTGEAVVPIERERRRKSG
jgi:CheY-like chemotaxis protein